MRWPILVRSRSAKYCFALLSIGAMGAIAAPGSATVSPVGLEYRLLAAHNAERARVGVPALQWDDGLAASAAAYGPVLARLGRLQHSPKAARPGQRENLWMGPARAYRPEQMVGRWIDEKQLFRNSAFPAVSTSGNWFDVAHYTTLVWRATTHVGCALHVEGSSEYLICRYSPPGNIDGRYAI